MNSKFYWIKLKKDFFKRHDIKILESYGSEYVLLYLKMLAESIDHNGRLRFSESVAYTPEMLSAIFQTEIGTIKKGLELLSDFGLIETEPDGTIRVTRFDNFVGSETEAAIKKRNQRNLPVLKNGSKRLNGSAVITPDGVTHTIDEKRYGGHGMQALDRAFGKCELCGSNENIVVHHNNGYSTELDDLVCLCVSCHGKAHTNKNNGHVEINRPPYVPHLSTDSTPPVCQMSTQSIDIRDKSIEIREQSIEKRNIKEKSTTRFIPPTVEEVSQYCMERKNGIDPQHFIDYYEARGWELSKGRKVKDWRACVRTWEGNQNKNAITTVQSGSGESIFAKLKREEGYTGKEKK